MVKKFKQALTSQMSKYKGQNVHENVLIALHVYLFLGFN